MIAGTGWRKVVIFFAVNCMHMKAKEQVTQVVAKNYSVAAAENCHVTIRWNAVTKASVNF